MIEESDTDEGSIKYKYEKTEDNYARHLLGVREGG